MRFERGGAVSTADALLAVLATTEASAETMSASEVLMGLCSKFGRLWSHRVTQTRIPLGSRAISSRRVTVWLASVTRSDQTPARAQATTEAELKSTLDCGYRIRAATRAESWLMPARTRRWGQ